MPREELMLEMKFLFERRSHTGADAAVRWRGRFGGTAASMDFENSRDMEILRKGYRRIAASRVVRRFLSIE